MDLPAILRSKELRALAPVVGVFLLVASLLGGAIWLTGDTFLGWLVGVNVCQTSSVLSALDFLNTVDSNRIILAERVLVIVVECTAIYIMVVFTALVIAYPFRWRIKAVFLPLGLLILYVTNIGRLVAVGIISRYASPEVFAVVHDILFQVAMVIVVLILWIVMLAIQRRAFDRRVALYILCVALACVAFELLFFWLATLFPESLPTSFTSFIVPTLAIILCAFNETWDRKLFWMTGALALFLLEGMAMMNSSIVQNAQQAGRGLMSVTAGLYVLAYMGIPIGAIMLFIGRKPNRLWGERTPKAID